MPEWLRILAVIFFSAGIANGIWLISSALFDKWRKKRAHTA